MSSERIWLKMKYTIYFEDIFCGTHFFHIKLFSTQWSRNLVSHVPLPSCWRVPVAKYFLNHFPLFLLIWFSFSWISSTAHQQWWKQLFSCFVCLIYLKCIWQPNWFIVLIVLFKMLSCSRTQEAFICILIIHISHCVSSGHLKSQAELLKLSYGYGNRVLTHLWKSSFYILVKLI